MTTRGRTVAVVLGAAVVAGLVLVGPPPSEGPPLDPGSTGPTGTRALVLLLEELGADVDVGDRPPAPGQDVALVLADDLGEPRREEVRAWVEAGGTLIVADPASPLYSATPELGGGLGLVEGAFDTSCDIPALSSVTAVEPPAGSVGYEVAPGTEGCYRREGAAFVLVAPRGEGTVVAVGGAGVFTNQAIGDAGNAVLAASLLAPRPGTAVAFLRPPAPGEGDQGLAELVGGNVKASLAQIGVAFGVYLLLRSRRLGAPVAEPQPVALESSELVVAVGNLLQQAHHHDRAARLVGDDLRRRLAERLGLSGDTPPDSVAAVVAARTAIPAERVLAAMVPPPLGGPDELVAATAAAEALHEEVVHG